MGLSIELKDETNTDSLRRAIDKRKEEGVGESLSDAFDRIRKLKNTRNQERLIEVAYEAMISGKEGRIKTGKLNREEVLIIGKKVLEEENKAKRQERINETIRTKPDNYYVITDDKDLPAMVERIREEVRLQQTDEWFQNVLLQFNDTYIKRKLAEQGIDIPDLVSFTVWDTETSGTDTMIDLSGGYSVWLPLLNEGYYVAYGHLTGDKQCTRSKALGAIKRFIEHPQHAKAFHNTSFDYSMFLNDGFKPRGFRYDSMDAAIHLNEHEESNGLKELFTKYKSYIGGEHLDDFTFEDLFGNGSPMPYSPEVVGIYAIKDVEKGWLLSKWQIDMINKVDNLSKAFFEIKQYLYEINTEIERTGFVINTERLAQLEEEYEKKLTEVEAELYTTYNIDDEFIRKMDRTINAKKIDDWIKAQERRIKRKKQQIEKKRGIIAKLENEDKTHLKRYTNEVETLAKYEKELAELAEPTIENAPLFNDEFNLNSSAHIGYLIYDVLKIEDRTKVFDKQAERSTRKNVLELYYEEEESLKPLSEYSKLSTLLGTFVKKIPEAIDYDGRIHTRLSTVSTGRYGSSGYTGKPVEYYLENITDDNYIDQMRKLVEIESKERKGTNLQNIPARTDEGVRVRMAFEPPEGCTFLGSDLSSIEPRIQAHRMETEFGDSSFAEFYRRGKDPYVEFASILFNVPVEICFEDYYRSVKGTKDEVPAYRSAMKQMFLAIGYGQAFDMFYKGVIPYGINELQAKVAYDKFDEILPGFKGMVEATFEHLRKHGWTETIFGQKRRFPGYVEKYKRIRLLMGRAGIEGKNDPELAKKTYKLNQNQRSEFWELMRFTGGCERAAFNHTIQGSGANILQLCMIRLYYECVLERGWEFNLTLHDELKTAVPNDQITEESVELFDDIMTNTYNLVLPLACDTVIEPRWMEEYSKDEWDFTVNKPK